MRSEAINHDLDTDQCILLVLRLHQLDHQVHNGSLVSLEWFGVGQSMQEREQCMSKSLQEGLAGLYKAKVFNCTYVVEGLFAESDTLLIT